MKILIDINHPAQVHLFKNFIFVMKKKGHEILVTAYDKEVAFKLLNAYKIPFENMGVHKKSNILKVIDLIKKDIKMFLLAKKFKPDLVMGLGSVNAAHVGFLTGIPSIIFDDDESSYWLYHAFATKIFGFSGFKITGPKITKIQSYKELAYLHPDQFKPDLKVFEILGIKKSEKFFIIRLVAWQAGHDIGKFGFDLKKVRELISLLKKHGQVLISSEKVLPPDLRKYCFKIAPEKLHHAMAFANLLVCDSGTMTTEAAVLGIPVVRCNSWVGPNDMGNFIELEKKYGLIYSFSDSDKAIDKVQELLKNPNLKQDWQVKRTKLLADKVNVTKTMVELVEKFEKTHTFTF